MRKFCLLFIHVERIAEMVHDVNFVGCVMHETASEVRFPKIDATTPLCYWAKVISHTQTIHCPLNNTVFVSFCRTDFPFRLLFVMLTE